MTARIPFYYNAAGEPQKFQPGDLLPMQYGGVGPKYRGNIGATSATTQIPYDNTTPLVTEGTQLWTATVTPSLATSNFLIEFAGMIDTSKINTVVTIAVFRGSTMIALVACGSSSYNGNAPNPFALRINDPATSLTPVTYSCRIGVDTNATTWYLNRGATGSYGSVSESGWSIQEEL